MGQSISFGKDNLISRSNIKKNPNDNSPSNILLIHNTQLSFKYFVLIHNTQSFSMNTNMIGFIWFSKIFAFLCFGPRKPNLSIGRLK